MTPRFLWVYNVERFGKYSVQAKRLEMLLMVIYGLG